MSDSVEEPPAREETFLSSFPISSLPDELALSCLARAPRSDHKALSLVSKSYHSLVMSPELYKMRSQLGRTEERLYVCVKTYPHSTPDWFSLRRQKTVNRLLRRTSIPSFPSKPLEISSVVVLDWGIYVIGGFVKNKCTSDVLLLDCRTNTWRHVPPMGVARFRPGAGVIDGKIYVFGGRPEDNSTNWGEVFDPKTQTWDSLTPLPDRTEDDGLIRESFVMDEKVYAVKWKGGSVYYSPREGKWGRTNKPDLLRYCYVEGLLYSVQTSYGSVFWRESDESEWKHVKGLEGLHMIFNGGFLGNTLFTRHVCQVTSFGVNSIVLLWYEHRDENFDIWCAEILLERRVEKGEVWGTIERLEAVATRARDPYGWGSRVEIMYAACVNV